MSMAKKGLVVALIHVALVSSIGAKLLVDRATRPRVWVRTAPVDPSLPIRGRYVSLRREVAPSGGLVLPEGKTEQLAHGATFTVPPEWVTVRLMAEGNSLVAVPSDDPRDPSAVRGLRDGQVVAIVQSPVAYFIPESAADPSRRASGEELWAEVTVPKSGLPRQIQLGVKKDGVITPLVLR